MGNCATQQENLKKKSSFNVQGYIFNDIIGKGGYGKVWHVTKRKNKQNYAMKIMSKVKILSKKSVTSVLNERKLLAFLQHPLIIGIECSFQDRDNLYLVMPYISGGDLRFHLQKNQFNEQHCIISSLEYIHQNNILHRDVKPENLIFDENGYVKITDFGISRLWRLQNSNETSGTPGYMAPEILMRQNYGIAVDYYALGVILYELAMGRRPYKATDRQELREQIMAKQVQIKIDEVPKGWSLESIDFINLLIQRKPQNRLGVNGPQEVKNHIWLKTVSWQKIYSQELEAPYKPQVYIFFFFLNIFFFSIKKCQNYYNNNNLKSEQSDIDKQNLILLRKNDVQSLFKGYEFDLVNNKREQSATLIEDKCIEETNNSKTCADYTDQLIKQMAQQLTKSPNANQKSINQKNIQQNQQKDDCKQNIQGNASNGNINKIVNQNSMICNNKEKTNNNNNSNNN
ncbi:protein kinase domain protein [Ichthyophthirius multifiliis]|uniref:non-specific serine/threonine protein kinase n=1 Tax=Ichthyophthirius multifiliis TaxID=5932 RepID=G0QK78_ICHMU|nr:protein kinase domain protein [Ichthyophthirius multifiliis]EGR34376.1 protein kinase domain protein [Ichthyophthirius multifiliis]|eukprot:XP_004039680.1 protein kinase domain protein [Ichthyophthirius multifiliis]